MSVGDNWLPDFGDETQRQTASIGLTVLTVEEVRLSLIEALLHAKPAYTEDLEKLKSDARVLEAFIQEPLQP